MLVFLLIVKVGGEDKEKGLSSSPRVALKCWSKLYWLGNDCVFGCVCSQSFCSTDRSQCGHLENTDKLYLPRDKTKQLGGLKT